MIVMVVESDGTLFCVTDGDGEGLLYGDIDGCGEFIGEILVKRCSNAPDGLFKVTATELLTILVHPTTGVFVACRFGSPGDVVFLV